MIDLSDQEWEDLFDKTDEVIQTVISELPEPVRKAAEEMPCYIDKYHSNPKYHILGMYMAWTTGPIFLYIGQIHEDCKMNIEDSMKSVRQVYLHELAHAIGKLKEYEVKERGL